MNMFPSRKAISAAASALLTFGVSACTVANPPSRMPSGQIGEPLGLLQAKPLGMISLTIRWPSRSTLAIPVEAQRIEAAVKDSSGNLLGQGSVTRDGAPTSLMTISELAIPITGMATITVKAFDAANSEVGVGSTTVKLVPNQKVSATLTMQETKVPSIVLINPAAAPAGSYVKVSGVNLPVSKDNLTVRIGGVSVAKELLTLSSDGTYLNFPVPAGATSDAISLDTGLRLTRSQDVFHTITALDLSQIGGALKKAASASFRVVARNSAGDAMTGVSVLWSLIDVSTAGGGGGASGPPAAGGQGPSGMPVAAFMGSFDPSMSMTTVSGGVAGGQGGDPAGSGSSVTPEATSTITFSDSGTATVEVRAGSLTATSGIVVLP